MRDSRQSLILIQSTLLNYVEQFSALPESRIPTTIAFIKESDTFLYQLSLVSHIPGGLGKLMLPAWLLPFYFIFLIAIGVLVLAYWHDYCLPCCSSTAGCCVFSITGVLLLLQVLLRPLAMFLGFYLPYCSPGLALAELFIGLMFLCSLPCTEDCNKTWALLEDILGSSFASGSSTYCHCFFVQC